MTGRREQILDTAARLFAERGFHGVSVVELGAACGISGPALYKHFPSKDAVLAEMLVAISEELLRVGRARSSATDDPAVALRALVAWHVDFALHHQPLIVVQDRDWANLPDDGARAGARPSSAGTSTCGPTGCARCTPTSPPKRSRAMAHAAFGLINSTPHSARLPEPEMGAMLEQMAVGALGLDVTHMTIATFKDLCLDAARPRAAG